MKKGKYDFIAELLELKKLTHEQKERILKLSVIEIQNESNIDLELRKRIELIEKKIKSIEEPFIEEEKKDLSLPTYIDPKGLSKFLIEYNQDPILKYTCHLLDDPDAIEHINNKCNSESYNFEKHQILIAESLDNLLKKSYINNKLKNLILVYITGKSFGNNTNKWSENIEINWASPELLAWSVANPGLIPNPGDKGQKTGSLRRNKGYQLNKRIISKNTGERINYFSELVLHFKNLFHIKQDNSLRTIVEFINSSKGKDWNRYIDFEIDENDFKANIELFTDVEKVIQAYNKIISIIISVSEKKGIKAIVNLSFKQTSKEISFEIHHQNSIFGKSTEDTIKRIGDEINSLITFQINGLCDLYLLADFGDNNYAKINLWDKKPRSIETIEIFNGVKYILNFKK